jgi:hypothetical protein
MTANRRTRFVRTLDRLELLASRRLGAVILFALALVVYALRAIAWPLRTGRDLDEYLLAYVQLFDRDVLLPWSMLFRTPITPLVSGFSLDVAGGAFAEPVAAVLFAASVVAWSAAALFFGPRVALAVAAALLLYPGYGLMFHELASEMVLAAAFAGWALLLTRAAFAPGVSRFALLGVGIAVLALVRPGNAVLLVFALFPLTLSARWRDRFAWAAVVAVAALLPLVAWSAHNGLRFGDYTLARGGNAIIPFYRAFITDHIVSPENGDASRRLATAMQRHLLTREPYRSYGVTLEQLFRKGSFRVHEDLYLVSDETFGWNSDYAVLRDAGLEGVRASPGTYSKGVLGTVWDELGKAYFRASGSSPDSSSKGPGQQPETIVVNGKRLPQPTEGEPVPAGQVVWISTPEQRIRQVWTSPTEWHLEFRVPSDRARYDEITRETRNLIAALPDRGGNGELGRRLNQLSRWFPRPIMWIVVGLVAVAVRRPRGSDTLIALGLAAFLVVLLNALGLFADLHFVLPVAPAFVLFALGGLLGHRRSTHDADTRPARPPSR